MAIDLPKRQDLRQDAERRRGRRRHRRLSKSDAATAYNFAVVRVFLCIFAVAGFALAFAALAL